MPLYLELFHGRKTLDEQLEDWGEGGPVFKSEGFFHTTYACEIKFGADGSNVLTIVEEMVYYDGMYYGDWSVFPEGIFNQDSGDMISRLVEFDKTKAALPV